MCDLAVIDQAGQGEPDQDYGKNKKEKEYGYQE
jgi:hypothetical protein